MIARANQFIGVTLSYGYAVAAILTFIEVCARYLFNAPTQWSIEIVILIAALHYLMSGPQASADDSHIRITVLFDRFSARGQRTLRVVERLVAIPVCAIVGTWAFYGAQFSIQMGERSGTNWNLPSPMILKVVVVFAFVMMGLQSLDHLIQQLRSRG